MKMVSEIVVLHEDMEMPCEGKFCPSFWLSKSFDADGNYYWEGLDGRWTLLSLTKKYEDEKDSLFEINIFQEHNRITAALSFETEDLLRYVKQRQEGRFSGITKITDIQNLCVAAMRIETFKIDDYKEFLQTVEFYLRYTNGIALTHTGVDALEFKAEFLDK